MNWSEEWHARQEAEDRYRREKEAENAGSPLPAILALGAVCLIAWLAGYFKVFR